MKITDYRNLFEASTVSPNPLYKKYWVDLKSDPTGKIIKVYKNNKWEEISSGGGGGELPSSIQVPFTTSSLFEQILSGTSYRLNAYIYDTATKSYTKIGSDLGMASSSYPGLMIPRDKIKVDSIPSKTLGAWSSTQLFDVLAIADKVQLVGKFQDFGSSGALIANIPMATEDTAGVMNPIDKYKINLITGEPITLAEYEALEAVGALENKYYFILE